MITLDLVLFRNTFPEFSSTVLFPDVAIQAQYDLGTSYVSAEDAGDLTGARRAYALLLITAHLLRLGRIVAGGVGGAGAGAVVAGANVDKVGVTLVPPPVRSMWAHWLAQTPYGQQLDVYLSMQAVGGMYVGGNPERAAFRKVGGRW